MKYEKSETYMTPAIMNRIMGPHPAKLTEELLRGHRIPAGAVVMDLGSGQGVTSAFLAKEYGFTVFAADLWSDPTDNMRFFAGMGLTNRQIVPVHADALALPFAGGFFDAVVCVDSYNYFGRDKAYLSEKLLPFIKPGGYVYIAVPGFAHDCHDDLPAELLLSWTPEQLDYMHDAAYWRRMVDTPGAETLSVCEMESNEEVWRDWIGCDNEYARGDRASIEAGALAHLRFISIVLRKR